MLNRSLNVWTPLIEWFQKTYALGDKGGAPGFYGNRILNIKKHIAQSDNVQKALTD